jgi:hypothetical protein
MLRFAPGIDWKDVSPKLLTRLNALAAGLHQIITVNSGYRTLHEQQVLYDRYVASGFNIKYIAAKPGQSQHEKGLAVDASIGGKSIGAVVGAKTLAKYGLSTPVKGDLPHVQLLEGGKPTALPQKTADLSQHGQEAAMANKDSTIPPAEIPPLTTDPSELHPPILPPGTVNPGEPEQPNYMQQAWLQVANQPNASPDTQQYAQMFGQ